LHESTVKPLLTSSVDLSVVADSISQSRPVGCAR
jgi:hypothetical protein